MDAFPKLNIIPSGAYQLTDIANLIREQTDVYVIIEADKNPMNCKMDVCGSVNFDTNNSIASLLQIKKQN